MKLSDIPDNAGKGRRLPCMRLTDQGLMLGRSIVLAKMDDERLCIDENPF